MRAVCSAAALACAGVDPGRLQVVAGCPQRGRARGHRRRATDVGGRGRWTRDGCRDVGVRCARGTTVAVRDRVATTWTTSPTDPAAGDASARAGGGTGCGDRRLQLGRRGRLRDLPDGDDRGAEERGVQVAAVGARRLDGVQQVCGRDRDQDAEADPVAEEGAADRLADDGRADERDQNERHEGTLVLGAHDALPIRDVCWGWPDESGEYHRIWAHQTLAGDRPKRSRWSRAPGWNVLPLSGASGGPFWSCFGAARAAPGAASRLLVLLRVLLLARFVVLLLVPLVVPVVVGLLVPLWCPLSWAFWWPLWSPLSCGPSGAPCGARCRAPPGGRCHSPPCAGRGSARAKAPRCLSAPAGRPPSGQFGFVRPGESAGVPRAGATVAVREVAVEAGRGGALCRPRPASTRRQRTGSRSAPRLSGTRSARPRQPW